MNINRHNYEEYFILYLDNELNSDDRRMVEVFVEQHPDLKEELDTLLQYKLVPDTHIVFDGKEELMKENGHSLVTAANYAEWLSLYIDNELDAEELELVQQFIAASPAAQKELELLQKTKLQPENIIFADKALLYRKEENVRRIIAFRWRVAAAVLILLLGATALIISNQGSSTDQPGVAVTKTVRPTTVPVENNTENNAVVQPVKETSTDVATGNKIAPSTAPFVAEAKNAAEKKQPAATHKTDNKTQGSVAVKTIVAPDTKTPDINPAVIKKEDAGIADNKPSNNLPQPLNNPNAVTGNKPDNAIAYTKPDDNTSKNISSAPIVTSDSRQPSDIIQASYPANGETLEQNDGKKNKNRGIFRKIARTFEKRTNMDPTDDNRLLVAGLSIKLK